MQDSSRPPSAAPEAERRVHFVSLGCPKNRVDTEVMLGVASARGYTHAEQADQAEVIVVNTCGFIDAAKEESIATILELARHKQTGSCRKLVVAGCLSQRFAADLREAMPEVDHFLGSSDMLRLDDVLGGSAERDLVGAPGSWVMRATDPRRLTTRGASAYLKIAEGCNRTCAFCVIPQIRGSQRSREPADILDEARRLVDAGVLELNLVSQDTVAYGRDLEGGHSLGRLVAELAELPGLRWLRLHYLYPESLGGELLALLAGHPKVLPYLDMPLQHASDAMLRRMRRGHGGDRLRRLVDGLRTKLPEAVLRTAFIVGHPGETEAEFEELCALVEWARFDHVGVFTYSDEESAASHALADKVAPATARRRARRLAALQRKIALAKNRARVGRTLQVLVEGPSEDSELVMVGRHWGQAPEVDGGVFLSGDVPAPGQMCQVQITRATAFDLLGEALPEDAAERDPATPTPRTRRPRSAAPTGSERGQARRVHLPTLP